MDKQPTMNSIVSFVNGRLEDIRHPERDASGAYISMANEAGVSVNSGAPYYVAMIWLSDHEFNDWSLIKGFFIEAGAANISINLLLDDEGSNIENGLSKDDGCRCLLVYFSIMKQSKKAA